MLLEYYSDDRQKDRRHEHLKLDPQRHVRAPNCPNFEVYSPGNSSLYLSISSPNQRLSNWCFRSHHQPFEAHVISPSSSINSHIPRVQALPSGSQIGPVSGQCIPTPPTYGQHPHLSTPTIIPHPPSRRDYWTFPIDCKKRFAGNSGHPLLHPICLPKAEDIVFQALACEAYGRAYRRGAGFCPNS